MANDSAERERLWLEERLATLNSQAEWQPNINRGLALLKARQAHRTRRIWTEVALLAAGLIVLVLPQPRVFAHYCLDCTVSFWQNLSSSGPAPLLQPETKRKPAHDFTLNDASGMPVQLSSLKGKVVLLNFWATWCHGCTLEIPWFIEFEKKYKDRGFEVIGISADDDGWKSVTPYVNEKKVNYTIVIGNPELSNLYRINAMPVTLLLDRDGKVAASWAGVISRADCRSNIEKLLGERPLIGNEAE